ncbi:MAG: hypothetical protein Q9191_007550 [Dirinaria sp. TL-2023a]
MPATRSSQQANGSQPSQAATPSTVTPSSVEGPIVRNVVSTFNLACRVDLQHVAQHARNATYNPQRFSAAILRIRDPKSTALVFSTGKVVVTGSRSEDDSRLAGRKFARTLQRLGYAAHFREWKLQNMVSSADSQMLIRLEGLSSGAHFPFCRYEPEIFPGLVYRMESPGVVLLVFAKGKVVITGAKSMAEVQQAWNNIYPALRLYQIVRE